MILSKEQLEIIKFEMEMGNPIKIGAKKHGIQIDDVNLVKAQLFKEFGKSRILSVINKNVMPSAEQMARDFAKDSVDAVKTSAKDRKIMADTEEFNRRISICNGCDFFDGSRCSVCGCFIKVKARFHGFKCPKGHF